MTDHKLTSAPNDAFNQVRYNQYTMKEARINNLLRSAITVCASAVLLLVELTGRAVSVIASGTKTSDTNDASNNAAHGGVLNYRSGKFDDGTDAAGWYEKD